MHFRVRKQVIQLIRTTYDADKKGARNVTVGRVRLSSPVLTDDLRSKLLPDEVVEFERWLESRHRLNQLKEEVAALTLAEALTLASGWFERAGDTPASREVAADIVFGWQNLRRLLVKKGLLE